MVSMISEGVKVSVETFYQQDYSNPLQSEFMFAYRITIENHNGFPVKLHSRHWHIFDAAGTGQEVEGEGVVGQQPVLKPGELYEYESACNLNSEIGSMHGTYLFVREADGGSFEVQIPRFELITTYRKN